MPAAVIYTRVSTEDQVRNTSLATQRDACEDWCERNGYDVARVFSEEGASAKTTNRPQLHALRAYCRENRGRVAVVVVNFLDRLGRNALDNAIVMAELAGLGISARSVTEPIDESPEGKLFATIFSGMAQFDNDRRALKTVTGMKATLSAGRWPFKGPIGYLNDRDSEGRPTLRRDPERAPLVKEAFRLFSTGRFSKRAVLETVSRRGLLTLKGHRVSPQTFGMMLRNPLYKGQVGVEEWGETYPARFESLVTEAVFDRVQSLLSERQEPEAPHLRNHPDFPLRVFVRCGRCERPLTGSWSTGRAKKKYGYYHCRNSKCLAVNEPKPEFEARFTEFLASLAPDPRFLRLFKEIVLDVWRTKQAQAVKTNRTLERKVETLRVERAKALEFFLRGRIDDEDYDATRNRIDQQIGGLKSEIARGMMSEFDAEAVLQFAEYVMLHPAEFWMKAKLDQRQCLQKVLFPEGITFGNGGFGTALNHSIFEILALKNPTRVKLASPTGLEPVSPP
jgi:site-specific DNA recombinase